MSVYDTLASYISDNNAKYYEFDVEECSFKNLLFIKATEDDTCIMIFRDDEVAYTKKYVAKVYKDDDRIHMTPSGKAYYHIVGEVNRTIYKLCMKDRLEATLRQKIETRKVKI